MNSEKPSPFSTSIFLGILFSSLWLLSRAGKTHHHSSTPDVPPTTHAQHRVNVTGAEKPNWKRSESVAAYGTIGLLIVNVFLMIATWRTATLNRQQIVGTFAAAIPQEPPAPRTIADDLEYLNYTGISMTFRNIGKTKATSFIAEATLMRRSLPDYAQIGIPQHKQTAKVEMRPYEQTGPQGMANSAYLRFDTDMFTQSDIKLLHGLGETIEVTGYFQYDNGFAETVREPFCFLYVTIPQHTFELSGAGIGGGKGGWYPCENMKSVIAEALKWKQKPSQP